ncbi:MULTISPECIES: aa3-type cytochrome c oxidase subunit IV [Sphingomonas]|nr:MULTISPECIES: aa3-type cytochrome c oxidase subunit IV [Sphingomonas]
MAIHTSDEISGPVDYKVHARDYAKVISMLKWGAVIAFILAMLVMVLLAS